MQLVGRDHVLTVVKIYFTCDGTKCILKDVPRASDPLDGGTLDISIVTRETGRCGNLFPIAFIFSIRLSFSRPSYKNINMNQVYT